MVKMTVLMEVMKGYAVQLTRQPLKVINITCVFLSTSFVVSDTKIAMKNAKNFVLSVFDLKKKKIIEYIIAML